MADDLDAPDSGQEGRNKHFMDIDRMVNEGLGGGTVTVHNGLIGETTTDTMGHPESVLNPEGKGSEA
jgi:hypothetical protein